MSNFIQSSALTKLFAAVFFYGVQIGAAVIIGIQLYQGHIPNTLLIGVVSYGIGKAAVILGINLGQSSTTQTEDRTIERMKDAAQERFVKENNTTEH